MPPPTGAHSIGDWDWWLSQAFPVGMPVKTTRSMPFENKISGHGYKHYRLPRGARAEVIDEPKWTGSEWVIPVRVTDARDESGMRMTEVIGENGFISVDVEEDRFWGIEPMEDRWPRGGARRRRTSRNPAPPHPRRPKGAWFGNLPDSYKRKIHDWMSKTYPPGTPIATLRDMHYSGGLMIPAGARGEVVGFDSPDKSVGMSHEHVWVRIVDARDPQGYRIDKAIGEVVGMSADSMRPLVDHWAQPARRTSRHRLPYSQRARLKPNPIPLPPRDKYAPRQTPEYLAWVDRTFQPGTPVRFLKPYMTYSQGGKLLDISPGAEGSVMESEHHPEMVHIWLASSDNFPYPCIAAVDTEFESIENILKPLQDNWLEVDFDDEPTQRHQSFLRLKANGEHVFGQPVDETFVNGYRVSTSRVPNWMGHGYLYETMVFREGEWSGVWSTHSNSKKVAMENHKQGVKWARSQRRKGWARLFGNPDADVEVNRATVRDWRTGELKSYDARKGAPVMSPTVGMTVTDGKQSRTTGSMRVGVITDVDHPRPGDIRVRWRGEPAGIVRRRDLYRVEYDVAANPEEISANPAPIEVGDELELERHPIYAHDGYVPSYKVTKRVVKWVDDSGSAVLVKLKGMRTKAYGGGYMDKVFRLTQGERGMWLYGDKARYAVLDIKKKR